MIKLVGRAAGKPTHAGGEQELPLRCGSEPQGRLHAHFRGKVPLKEEPQSLDSVLDPDPLRSVFI